MQSRSTYIINHLIICCTPDNTEITIKHNVSMIFTIKGITLPLGPWITYPKAYHIRTIKIARPIEAQVRGK